AGRGPARGRAAGRAHGERPLRHRGPVLRRHRARAAHPRGHREIENPSRQNRAPRPAPVRRARRRRSGAVTHSRAQDMLSPYLEGDLSESDRSAVESHLAACAECSEELELQRDTVALLRRLPTPEAPPFLVSRVMARIADGEAQPGGWWHWLSQASVPVIGAAFAAAPAAFIVFAFATPSGEDAGTIQVVRNGPGVGGLIPQFTGGTPASV